MEQRETLSLIPPPPGVTSNFENPEYIGDVVVVSNLVLLVLSTLVFFTGIYTRRVVVHSVDFGDYALAVGWFLSLGFFVSCVFWARHGLGIHAWDMPVAGFSLFSKMAIIAGAFYSMSTLSIKLSILSFYLRISPFRKFRICVYGLAVLIIAYCLVQMLQFTYSCRPMAKAWDLSITTGSCSGALEMCVTNSAANAAVDIAMLILPIAMLWNVRMAKRDKIGVVAFLMTGSLHWLMYLSYWEYVVKFAWPSDKRQREGRLLKLAKDRGVTGIAEWFNHKQITIDGDPDTISHLRQAMEFGAQRKLSSKVFWVDSGTESSRASRSLRGRSKSSMGRLTGLGISTSSTPISSSGQKRTRDEGLVNGRGGIKRSKLDDS
ncbi:hypothetical protein DL95DRAFT_451707 [Leptodontidium sp. 2 PMI_412]|nr:hypothetical protein DL95DRAFT_451707 [Leptodontidium sp. 2 PMI_412]